MRNPSTLATSNIGRITVSVVYTKSEGVERLSIFTSIVSFTLANPADLQKEQKAWEVKWPIGELADDDIMQEARDLLANYMYENGN